MQAQTTHRLLPPAMFLAVSLVLLAAVSMGMKSARTTLLAIDSGETESGPSLLSGIRAYPVGVVAATASLDGQKVVLEVGVSASSPDAGSALCADVRSGVVDTLLFAGSSWQALSSGSKELTLTSKVMSFSPSPLPKLATISSWMTSWNLHGGAGALFLAFKNRTTAAQ